MGCWTRGGALGDWVFVGVVLLFVSWLAGWEGGYALVVVVVLLVVVLLLLLVVAILARVCTDKTRQTDETRQTGFRRTSDPLSYLVLPIRCTLLPQSQGAVPCSRLFPHRCVALCEISLWFWPCDVSRSLAGGGKSKTRSGQSCVRGGKFGAWACACTVLCCMYCTYSALLCCTLHDPTRMVFRCVGTGLGMGMGTTTNLDDLEHVCTVRTTCTARQHDGDGDDTGADADMCLALLGRLFALRGRDLATPISSHLAE